jgi:hypothetical protein
MKNISSKEFFNSPEDLFLREEEVIRRDTLCESLGIYVKREMREVQRWVKG